MNNRIFLIRALALVLMIGLANTASAVTIETRLSKTSTGEWQVSYQLSEPVMQLQFVRHPDKSRHHRWHSMSAAITLESSDDEGFIRHRAAQPFQYASFRLTPTYVALPKDYAPFSPFSDGGTLIHSGRFFVCAARCDGSENHWQMSLLATETDRIILDGQVHVARVDWTDQDSGQNLYVGPVSPEEDDNFISVVDPALPEALKQALTEHLPRLMSYFQERYGSLSRKPMLFASRSETTNGRYGHQGGVLPQQVFMHWYGPDLESRIETRDVFWFFAHEIAHLYQKKGVLAEPASAAWIHEGGAEYMASLAVRQLLPDSAAYLDGKLQQAKIACAEGLGPHSLLSAVERNRFDLYYSCGLLIHAAIDTQLSEPEADSRYHLLWQMYLKSLNSTESDASSVFLSLIEPQLVPTVFDRLHQLIHHGATDVESLIDSLDVGLNQG